jgi:hypothetical protein
LIDNKRYEIIIKDNNKNFIKEREELWNDVNKYKKENELLNA